MRGIYYRELPRVSDSERRKETVCICFSDVFCPVRHSLDSIERFGDYEN